jgi:hypothetical protein
VGAERNALRMRMVAEAIHVRAERIVATRAAAASARDQ